MKRKIKGLFGVPAILLFALPAFAQLTVSFSQSSQSAPQGASVDFSVTITNTGSQVEFLNGDSISLFAPGATTDDSDFLFNAPTSLSPGEMWTGVIFRLTVGSDTPPDTYDGSFSIYGGADSSTFDVQGIGSFQAIIASPLTGVVSRMIHGSAGTFDLNLPLTGNPGIECRRGGPNGNYTIVFSFMNTLTSASGASLVDGTGSVTTSSIDSDDAHNYIVNLTGVTDAQVITVNLGNVTDSAGNVSSSASIQMGVLVGDTNADGFTDAMDVSQTKSQSGNAVTQSNFREDLNVDGFIDAVDVSLVKSKSGTALPTGSGVSPTSPPVPPGSKSRDQLPFRKTKSPNAVRSSPQNR